MSKKIGWTVLGVLAAGYAALVAYAYWPQPPGVPAKSLAAEGDLFATVDGLSIRYRVYGTPGSEKPTLVLIHGFGNSLQSFRNLAPLLADNAYVVALDLPGYGLSVKPTTFDYSNAGQAKLVIAFAHQLGIARPIYGGHSMGGAIALHCGVSDPAAAGIVFIDPGIWETGVPKITAYAPFPLPRISAKLFGDRAWREKFMKISFVNPAVVTPAVMDDLARGVRTDDYWSGTTAMMSSFKPGEEPPLLEKVKVPVVSIFGVADRNHPDADRKRLQAAIPGSTLVVIDGAGHYPHEEQAEAVADVIKAALAAWARPAGEAKPS